MPVLDDDSGSDHEDELPQVVVLKTGDLSADEVKKIKNGTASVKKRKINGSGITVSSVQGRHVKAILI